MFGQSMQSRLMAISALNLLNVSVTVTTMPQNILASNLHHVQWSITFHNADYRFPRISLAGGNLVTNRTYAGLTMTTNVSQPGNPLGGTFTLSCAGDTTNPLPFDASPLRMASELEGIVGVVGVTRTPLGLDHGYTWTITFFGYPGNIDVPLLVGDATGLYGTLGLVTPETPAFQVLPLPPLVSVTSIQRRSGRPATYQVLTSAKHFEETIKISYRTTTPNSDSSTVSFTLLVTDPVTNNTALLGPIYPTTVSMAAEELNAVEWNNLWPRDRVPGTSMGTSLQSMFRALPLFQTFASDVTVNRTSVVVTSGTASLTVSWEVVFKGASSNSLLYSVDPAFNHLSAGGSASVKILHRSNPIGGTFQLSFGGYLTSVLPYNATADTMRSTLMQLPSVFDASLGLGDVSVARMGPDLQGAYSWLVAVVEETGTGASMAFRSVATPQYISCYSPLA